ncbi:MAG: hypothetical protein LBV67_10690 [Streptococcaceae bacterium]|jgi:hypothetical protein|nr:hypothetical protein [Streptococcaceae bacterium]
MKKHKILFAINALVVLFCLSNSRVRAIEVEGNTPVFAAVNLRLGSGNYHNPPPNSNLNLLDYFYIPPISNSSVDVAFPSVALVTNNQTSQRGLIYSRFKMDLSREFYFEGALYIGPSNNADPNIHSANPVWAQNTGNRNDFGDGMAFVMHNDIRQRQAHGLVGENLGLYDARSSTQNGNMIRNSLAIEFDTYRNSAASNATDAPTSSGVGTRRHIAFTYPERFVGATGTSSALGGARFHLEPRLFENYTTNSNRGSLLYSPFWKDIKIQWLPSQDDLGGTLSYTIYPTNWQGIVQAPVSASHTIADYRTHFALTGNETSVFWGFTGATGGFTSVHAMAFRRINTIADTTVAKEVYSGGNFNESFNKEDVKQGASLTYEILTTNQGVTGTGLRGEQIFSFKGTIPEHTRLIENSPRLILPNGQEVSGININYNALNRSYEFIAQNHPIQGNETIKFRYDVQVNLDAPIGTRLVNKGNVLAAVKEEFEIHGQNTYWMTFETNEVENTVVKGIQPKLELLAQNFVVKRNAQHPANVPIVTDVLSANDQILALSKAQAKDINHLITPRLEVVRVSDEISSPSLSFREIVIRASGEHATSVEVTVKMFILEENWIYENGIVIYAQDFSIKDSERENFNEQIALEKSKATAFDVKTQNVARIELDHEQIVDIKQGNQLTYPDFVVQASYEGRKTSTKITVSVLLDSLHLAYVPSLINFGERKISGATIGTFLEKPLIEGDLIVWDYREGSNRSPWSVSLQLGEALTLIDEEQETLNQLPNGLFFGSRTTPHFIGEKTANVLVYSNISSNDRIFDLTNFMNGSHGDGFMISHNHIDPFTFGQYQGSVVWVLSTGPSA